MNRCCNKNCCCCNQVSNTEVNPALETICDNIPTFNMRIR